MTDPTKLTDAALEAAIVVAEVRRLAESHLGIRTEIADLEAERTRRAAEVAELRGLWTAPDEADRLTAALSWLLEQWLSDVDPDWADHVLDGLRAEDPQIFATLDALNVEDAGEPLLPGDGSVRDGAGRAASGEDGASHRAVVPAARETFGGGAA